MIAAMPCTRAAPRRTSSAPCRTVVPCARRCGRGGAPFPTSPTHAHGRGGGGSTRRRGEREGSWDGPRQTVAMVLGLGLSGVPYTGPDIGGFSGSPSVELYVRWF